MKRIVLRQLSVVGTNVPPASIDFGDRLTLVHGASDTGKSFIVSALDFILGGKKLLTIPELNGYSYVLLEIQLPDQGVCTLARPVSGGDILLFDSAIDGMPPSHPDLVLRSEHSATDEHCLSRFLLRKLDLEGKQVRKNNRNEVRTLSFRDLVHLAVIDETKIQSRESPIHFGQVIKKTEESSIFQLVLTGIDDAGLVAVPTAAEVRKIGTAQVEIVSRIIDGFVERIGQVPERAELEDQLERLNATIKAATAAIKVNVGARDQLKIRRNALSEEISAAISGEKEGQELAARFSLLLDQYVSDLKRLQMVAEVGEVLGFFEQGTCVFCGAEPQHQHQATHQVEEATRLSQAVRAESQKTVRLRDDLLSTLSDLAEETRRYRTKRDSLSADLAVVDSGIERLDKLMAPSTVELSALIEQRRQVERVIGGLDQVEELEQLKKEVGEPPGKGPVIVKRQNEALEREFAELTQELLVAWGIPEVAPVRYDTTSEDLVAGDRPRASRGKGTRAIIHAAFTLGLAQYCYRKEAGHPGFVVLDSPVVTFKKPDDPEPEDDAELVTTEVGDTLYSYLQGGFSGQAIIMENVDPTEPLPDGSVSYRFTKQAGLGRYGFFPMVNQNG